MTLHLHLRLDLEPLFLRMADGTATSPEDLAMLARLAGRPVKVPHHPALDRAWESAHCRPRIAAAMHAASHWRIRVLADLIEDPENLMCPHLADPTRCGICPR